MNTITILCGLLLLPHDEAAIWVIDANREMRAGFVVQIPSGSSDFVNVAHAVETGLGNSDDLVDGLPLTGMAVSVADFGSGRTFPMVGVFGANLALDASGRTPDLASPIVTLVSPPNPAPALFTFAEFDTPEVTIPLGTTTVHSVVQLPPGDPGLLQVGASQTYFPVGTSGFSSNGYATAAQPVVYGDFGLSLAQDNSTTASCKAVERKPHGRLRLAGEDGCHEVFADHLTVTLQSLDQFDLGFFGPQSGDVWRLYFNVAGCTATIPIGPVLGTIPDSDGDGSYLRVHTTWPSGFAGQTFRFSAAWGNPGCASPGVGFTNCVTIITKLEASFGLCDDGTIESGWVVQIPSASSDYFNNRLGDASSQNGIVAMTVAVLDFGTAIPAYPKAGVSDGNYLVDPSGNTPDLTGFNLLATITPFTFPPGTFATTSGQYVSHGVSVACPMAVNAHAWIQFPPGDSGLLGVGADTSSGANGCSFFTLDGYATPAVSFFPNWGLRLATN